MAKQLNIDLNFNANTEKAKQSILDLQKSLSNIAKMPGSASSLFDDRDIKQASQAALELSKHLKDATNVNTGKLDLSRFSLSLKSAGKDLNKYYDSLLRIGPEGQKAFLQMASAVASAETPIIRVNKKLEEMGTVLKNTVRWQISSTILHSFMGSVQKAYGYAKDLNESLNNIRIVTGQNADQMSKFAIEANRAAKELSTTTNEYAKASLIYYQQGLNDQEVKARTDITMKMANVSRESAQTVSDQMTAVWNNFYDGSQSLESYADAMTALGAATASSTSEISEGLNKFAAIASTVGLSYEYATSALATVTATTRQSADIVGTAFKTMFARIQGLKLGETLEDGTTLNKYSEALMKVGINIKDSNGALKDMDNILGEMATKWKVLEKDQQVALAQTVAGTRQYTQLVALMDNWDFMESNLQVVEESNGALAQQQAIYEQGWEAASDRVRAAMESIYSDLLDDDFFVTLLNGFSKVLDAIHGVTEGLGGMKGVAAFVGSTFMNLYAKRMPKAMQDLRANFMVFTGQSETEMQKVQNKTNDKLQAIQNNSSNSESIRVQAQGIEQVSNMQQKLLLSSKKLTAQEKEDYKIKIENVHAMYEEATVLAKIKEEKEKNLETTKKDLAKSGRSSIKDKFFAYVDAENEVSRLEKKFSGEDSDMDQDQYEAYSRAYDEQRKKAADLEVEIGKLHDLYGLTEADISLIIQKNEETGEVKLNSEAWKAVAKAVNDTADEFIGYTTQLAVLDDTQSALTSQIQSWQKNADSIEENSDEAQDLKKNILDYLQVIKNIDKDNHLDLFDKDDLQELEQIEDAIKDTSSAQEMLKQISTFSNKFDKKASEKITNFDELLGALRDKLKHMGFNDDSIRALEEGAESSAEAVRKLLVALQNADEAAKEIPPSTFHASEAFSELGSTLMSTYSLITSVTSAFEVFGDKGATAIEKVGASVSILMSATSAYNSIGQLSTSLTKNEAIAKRVLGKANSTAALTTTELSDATRKLSIKITLIAAAIAVTVKVLDILIVTQKEANKKIQEATDIYKEESEKLKGIKEQLKDTADRMQELKEKGPLTIVEEAELTKLESTNAQLERQKDLQEQIAKEKAKQAAKEIKKNWSTASKLKGYVSTVAPGSGYVSGGGSTSQANSYYAAAFSAPENSDLPDAHEMTKEQREAWLAANQDIIQQNEETYLNYILAMQEAGEEVDREFVNTAKERIAEGRQMLYGKDYEDKVLGSAAKQLAGKASEADFQQNKKWSETLGQDTLDSLGIQEKEFDAYVSNAISNAKKVGITSEQLAKLDAKALQTLIQYSEELAENYHGEDLLQFLTNYGYEIPSISEKMKTLKEEFEKINQISKEISIGKILSPEDYKNLINYNAELSKYFTLLADGSAKFIGDPLDFQQEIKAQNRNNLIQLQEDAKEVTAKKQQELNNFFETGVNPLTEEQFSQISYGHGNYETYLRSVNSNYANKHNGKMNEVQKAQANEQAITNEIAFTATNYNERQALLEKENINQEAYAKAAEVAMNQEAWEGLDIEEVQEYSDYLEDAFGIAEEGAEDVARSVSKMNKGVEVLNSNWEEWGDILKSSSKDSQEYTKAMSKTKHALSDVLDVSEDFIDADWVEVPENLALIEKAAEGDAKAIDALGKSLAEDIAFDKIDEFDSNHIFNIEGEEYDLMSMKELFSNTLDEMSLKLDGTTLNPGDSLDNTSLITKLNEMVTQTGMSVEEANAMYSSMGFTPHFKRTPITAESIVPITTKHHHREYIGEKDPVTGEWTDWVDTEYSTTEEKPAGGTKIAALTMTTEAGDYRPTVPSPEIEGATYVGGGRMNNFSSSNPGGKKSGGGSKKKHKPTTHKKSDTVERYKEINDKLDDLTDSLDEANKATDRLYGNSKLKQMEKVNNLLQNEVSLLKKKKQEAQDYLREDTQNLQSFGIDFKLDEKGNITNYTSVMTDLFHQLQSAQDVFDASEGEDEAAGEALEAIKDRISKIKDAISQYDETRELIEDLNKEAEDTLMEWQDKNYEMLSYKLEINLEINDSDLEILDYYMSKHEGNFYKMAEAAGYLEEQYKVLKDTFIDYQEAYAELKENRNQLSQEDYVEGLKEIRSGALENLQSLKELDNAMLEYYGNTLVAAGEELAKFTDRIGSQNAVLEHYNSILGLMGKSSDYKAIGKILEGQVKMAENTVQVAKKEYDLYAKEVQEKYRLMREAEAQGNAELAELLKKQWEAAEQESREAQDRWLTAIEEWGEKVNALLTNQLEKASQELNRTLAGEDFASLEQMSQEMERAAALQEEYLTTTNKIYETDKLIRKAQNDLNTVNSTMAKNKYKNYIKETEALKNQGKVSEYELKIQQAKYDLLVAEIALEDAQNAKSTVRLQRDDEGNFSYIYTADQNAIDDAIQKHEDAQNNLYNIGLDGAEDYRNKYQQTMTDMWDTLTELAKQKQEGQFASEEEYNDAILKAKNYYYEQLNNYADLYQVALDADLRVAGDSWTTHFSNLIQPAETWATKVDGYLTQVNNAFNNWSTNMDKIANQSVGTDFGKLSEEVDFVTKANQDLITEITKPEGVLDAIKDQVSGVNDLTLKYGDLRTSIAEVIKEYEKLANQTNANIKYESSILSVPDRERIEELKILHSNTTDKVKQAQYHAEAEAIRKKYGYSGGADGSEFIPIGFDTGGYTGDWGPNGKLAVLHEKEIILNSNDTENLLSAITLTREMLNMIDLNAKYASTGFGLLTAKVLSDEAKNIIEQNVQIEANFPNVNSRIEIEEAFNNLINTATQYTNRK